MHIKIPTLLPSPRVRILEFIRANPAKLTHEIAAGVGMHPDFVRFELAGLREDGEVMPQSTKRPAYPRWVIGDELFTRRKRDGAK